MELVRGSESGIGCTQRHAGGVPPFAPAHLTHHLSTMHGRYVAGGLWLWSGRPSGHSRCRSALFAQNRLRVPGWGSARSKTSDGLVLVFCMHVKVVLLPCACIVETREGPRASSTRTSHMYPTLSPILAAPGLGCIIGPTRPRL